MLLIIISILVIILSFIFEYIFTKKQRKTLAFSVIGIVGILSVTFLIFNLTEAFSTIDYFNDFLSEYGITGLIALILKTGFIFLPFVINIVIYLVVNTIHNKNTSEIDKMIAKDI
jgi:cytochrome c biogenesis factor